MFRTDTFNNKNVKWAADDVEGANLSQNEVIETEDDD